MPDGQRCGGNFQNQLLAAQHHYFKWKNPGFEGTRGYEDYLLRQRSDAGDAKARFDKRKATQPIGTPDEIIEKIANLQRVISLNEIVVHVRYGGMPHEKALRSMRLFAERVLPAVQAMATPINPASSGG